MTAHRFYLVTLITIGLCFMLIDSGVSNAQAYEQWVSPYNSQADHTDLATAITVDADGNVYVTGYSDSTNGGSLNSDFLTIKYNSMGLPQWTARYTGAGAHGTDKAQDIEVDRSGNVYVTGYAYIVGDRFATVKYNSNGVQQWSVENGQNNSEAFVLGLDNQRNVYVGGNGDYGGVTKYNQQGITQWTRWYNGYVNEGFGLEGMAVDSAGNAYLLGIGDTAPGDSVNDDIIVAKYNSNGNLDWVSHYDGPNHEGDCGNAITLDDGDVYIVGGIAGGPGFGTDIVTIKYDEFGNEVWSARFNGPGNASNDTPVDIKVDSDHCAIVTGYCHGSNGGGCDYVTIKYDASGNELWQNTYGCAWIGSDYPVKLAVDSQNNVYVTGFSDGQPGTGDNFDYATVKYSSTGQQVWVSRYNGTGNDEDRASDIAVDQNGKVFVTGFSDYNGAGSESYNYLTIQYGEFHPVNLTLTPENLPVLVPSSGGSFNFTLSVHNDTTYNMNCDLWTMAQLPDGSWYGPLQGPISCTLSPGQTLSRFRNQTVPANSPVGLYTYEARVGTYPDSIWDSDRFQFTKLYPPPNPDTLWTRCFGGAPASHYYGNWVLQTPDGGFLAAGSATQPSDAFLVKTNAGGDSLWTHYYGGSEPDGATVIQPTNDGAYIMGGSTMSYGSGSPGRDDFYLVKIDAQGNEIWHRAFGGPETEQCNDVRQTSDGGFIMVGYVYVGDYNLDIYLVKTNALGNELWSRTFDFSGGGMDESYSVRQTRDGGYIIVGDSGFLLNENILLLKTDAQGLEQWHRTYPTVGSERAQCVQQTTDGGYIVTGNSSVYAPCSFYLMKTDQHGNVIWDRGFGGAGLDYAENVYQAGDGGYVLTGWTSSFGYGNTDVYLIKTDSQGNEIWSQTYGGQYDEHGKCTAPTADGGYIVTGLTYGFGAYWTDLYLLKLQPANEFEGLAGMPPTQFPALPALKYELYSNHPNPFNATTAISYELPSASHVALKVYDSAGRLVATLVNAWHEAGNHQITFDGSNLPSGVYIYRLHAGEFSAAGKMVLLK
jgi:uncharacterized delta-60 repeat protein